MSKLNKLLRPDQGGINGFGAVAQLVAHLHGMQGVRGSSPLSSTGVLRLKNAKGPSTLEGPFCIDAWVPPRARLFCAMAALFRPASAPGPD